MPVCHCCAIDTVFDARVARRDLAHYRRHGPARTTRRLLDALLVEPPVGRTLLDIGGGVGIIAHEVLQAGARQAMLVDAASAYTAAAQSEAARRGHADRLDTRHGDFVALAGDLAPADLVTLDRVICCYPDMPALVRQSAALARQAYGLVYPRDDWWVRLGLALVNVTFRLQRRAFRVFAHPTAAVDSLVRDQGLIPRARSTTLIWQIVVYTRP